MSKVKLSLLSILLIGLVACESRDSAEQTPAAGYAPPVTLFVAGELITMSDTVDAAANAVAVQNGKILEVGDSAQLQQKYEAQPGFSVNDSFKDKVLGHLCLSA